MVRAGKVFLVGAGPGDPELLTLKAARLIANARVLVHDRLVSDAILAMASADAIRVDVGKSPKRHPVPQDAINATLIAHASAGYDVVRLKGGDPFIFGRGGEEALALAEAGIACEVVPGITAAQGAAASVGIPLTHRGVAEHVTYLTGHCRADQPLDFDFAKLADPTGTLVVYMGLATIGEISRELIAHGLAPDTPVLVVNRATTARERRLFTTLSDCPGDILARGLEGPSLFVIGAVAGLAGQLATCRDEVDAYAVAAQ